MGNKEALGHLETAIDRIDRAREEAEKDVAETELYNLWKMAEDCKSGLQSDVVNEHLQ